jgi:hypothetical protein
MQQQQQPQYSQALPTQAYPMPQQQQQQPTLPPGASLSPGTVGMCLFKDGKPDYNPYNAAAAVQGKLANSYWGPCPMTTTSGAPGAPAGVPLGPAPPTSTAPPTAAAAAGVDGVSGSSVSVASAAAAEPAQSSAGIRSPEAFVKAEGAATQVRGWGKEGPGLLAGNLP